jgi:NAD(P)-dependent dehydrogenase (short-subunit alcohol dehydrogenase family)
MEISGSVALVSGANRGLGRAFAPVLAAAGGGAIVAVEAGQIEVLADQRSRDVKASLSRDHELIYPPIQNSGTLRSAAPADMPS